MRNTIIILLISLIAISCGKDKFTSDPQIKFKSIKPDRVRSNVIINSGLVPEIIIGVTDLEGDLGFQRGEDTSLVYIKHRGLNRTDSFRLPDIKSVTGKNFESDIIINTFDILRANPGNNIRPRVDTLYYDIYVVDFAKHKSNVVTAGPLYYEIQ
jgi:hypothetical protein